MYPTRDRKNYKLCTTQNCYMKALLPFLFLYWSRPRLNVFIYIYRFPVTDILKLFGKPQSCTYHFRESEMSHAWQYKCHCILVLETFFLQRGLSLIRVGIWITCIRKVLIFANSCPGNVSKTLSLSHAWQCPTRDTKSLLLNIHQFMERMSILVIANAFWASNKYILM